MFFKGLLNPLVRKSDFVARQSSSSLLSPVVRPLSYRKYNAYIKRRNPYLMSSYNKKPETPNANGEARELFKPLVWIDCEMTGLDHHKDRIIEICCIITDGNYNIVNDNCFESVIHYDSQIMNSMNDWCIEHHGSSGLTKRVLESDKSLEQVEQDLLNFIQKYIPTPNVGVLAGNSVHMDRLFMLKDFPKVINHLFYRIIDVSTIMEVSFRHNQDLANVAPRKEKAHTAKKDILESIEQLQWYTKHYLKDKQETRLFVQEQEAIANGKLSDQTTPNAESELQLSNKRQHHLDQQELSNVIDAEQPIEMKKSRKL